MIIKHNNDLHSVFSVEHRTPGNLRAFIQAKLRNLRTGAMFEHRFRSPDPIEKVNVDEVDMQFLYADGADAHFMDTESFEQIAIPETAVQEALRFLTPSSEVDVLFIDDQPGDLQLPSAVDLTVTETDPGLRGDSVSGGGTKPATLETGAVIQVPLFVEQGQRIRVDTRSGEYVARA